jgi:hypothetical protein
MVNLPEGGMEYDNDHDVILVGDGTWIVYDQPGRPWADVWTAHTVPLIEGPGWVNKATGLEPTQEEMQAVLASLQHLLIRAEFWQGESSAEDTGLDNVKLGCAVITGVPDVDMVEEASVSLETLARPSPSRGRVAIQYELPREGTVQVRIFDVRGALVRDLWSGWRERGSHVQHWDGTTDSGQRVATGVYFYRVEAGGLEGNGKLILLR